VGRTPRRKDNFANDCTKAEEDKTEDGDYGHAGFR